MDVNVLGSFPTPDDVVAPFDARGIVLVDLGRNMLGEAQVVNVQNFSNSH